MVTFLRYDAFIEGARIPMAARLMPQIFFLMPFLLQHKENRLRYLDGDFLTSDKYNFLHSLCSFQISFIRKKPREGSGNANQSIALHPREKRPFSDNRVPNLATHLHYYFV